MEQQSKNELVVSREEKMLMPIAENYIQMFPEILNDKNFNAKQSLISMALKMQEVKDKAGRSAIDVCTKESIMQVAQEVLVKKLDIMKNQAALIVRGDKLMLQPQYQGNVRRALELNPFLSHFNFVPIYKGDQIEMEILADGRYGVKSHKTSFNNISNNNLVGGYVRAIKKDGSVYMTEVMTMEQIKMAWSKSSNSSLSVHKAFPLRMARKTILNALCSWLINTTGEVEEQYVSYDNEEDVIREPIEVVINEEQAYSEPIVAEEVEEEPNYETIEQTSWTTEEMDSVLNEIDEEEQEEGWFEVKYKDWKNNYSLSGEYEIKPHSFNNSTRNCLIRKKQ